MPSGVLSDNGRWEFSNLVTIRCHLLNTRVGALSFPKRLHLGFGLQAGCSIVKTMWRGPNIIT